MPRHGACAYAVVRRVFEQDAWADRALHGEARRLRLDARDLALATQLSYGTVQRVATLDHVIERLTRRAASKLDPPVLAALRLGVFQLTFLDRVPAHAAVGESVELAKRDAPRGAGLVNAVLRRAGREGRGDRRAAARRHARAGRAEALAPGVDRRAVVGRRSAPRRAKALMAADNEPAEPSLRANTLKTTAAGARRAHPRPRRRRRGADPRRPVRHLRGARVARRAC